MSLGLKGLTWCRPGKWFEPRGISYLFGVIARVKVVSTLKMTTAQVVETSVTYNSLPSPERSRQTNKWCRTLQNASCCSDYLNFIEQTYAFHQMKARHSWCVQL